MEKKKTENLRHKNITQQTKKLANRGMRRKQLGIKSHLGFQCIEGILKND